jgi:hypothetical protein
MRSEFIPLFKTNSSVLPFCGFFSFFFLGKDADLAVDAVVA